MPIIPDADLQAGGNYLKPDKMGLNFGDRTKFTITGAHEYNTTSKLYAIPVKYGSGSEGKFSLNATHRKMIADALGKNSDSWVGATFDAIVGAQNNPQTHQQVKSWTVLRETITPKK